LRAHLVFAVTLIMLSASNIPGTLLDYPQSKAMASPQLARAGPGSVRTENDLFVPRWKTIVLQADARSYPAEVELDYVMNVTLADATMHTARIEMSVEGTFTPYITLSMHKYQGDNSESVSDVRAYNEKGRILAIESRIEGGERFWRTEAKDSKRVRITYNVSLGRLVGAGHLGYLGTTLGVSMAEWIFLVPADIAVKGITVRFFLPEGWNAYVPWDAEQDFFRIDSLEYFTTSTLAFGNFTVHHKAIGVTNVSIIMPSDWPKDVGTRIANTAFRVFEYQAGLFGKSVGDRYLGIFTPAAEDDVDIFGGEYTQGQGLSIHYIPRVVEMDRPRFEWPMQQFAHRLFHRWNAWAPYGMTPATEKETWFVEGSSVYYQYRVLIDLNITYSYSSSIEDYRTYLNDYYKTRYDVALADAYNLVSEGLQDKYTFIAYNKGALVCLLLDLEIRGATAGDKRADDLMKSVYLRFGSKKGAFTNEDLLEEANSIAKRDFSSFFDRYVFGVERIPLDEYFTRIELLYTSGQKGVGKAFTIATKLTTFGGNPVPNATVYYCVDSRILGYTSTDTSGQSDFEQEVTRNATYTILVLYRGDASKLQSAIEVTIEAQPASVTLRMPSLPDIREIFERSLAHFRAEIGYIIPLAIIVLTLAAYRVHKKRREANVSRNPSNAIYPTAGERGCCLIRQVL